MRKYLIIVFFILVLSLSLKYGIDHNSEPKIIEAANNEQVNNAVSDRIIYPDIEQLNDIYHGISRDEFIQKLKGKKIEAFFVINRDNSSSCSVKVSANEAIEFLFTDKGEFIKSTHVRYIK